MKSDSEVEVKYTWPQVHMHGSLKLTICHTGLIPTSRIMIEKVSGISRNAIKASRNNVTCSCNVLKTPAVQPTRKLAETYRLPGKSKNCLTMDVGVRAGALHRLGCNAAKHRIVNTPSEREMGPVAKLAAG